MNDRKGLGRGARWAAAVWTGGTTAVIAALPWTVSNRLPDHLATHWDGLGDRPDGSMPLWAASLFPAAIWLALALALLLIQRRTAAAAGTGLLPWTAAGLLTSGIVIAGAQASIVRANLDRTDWHQARQPTVWIVASLAAAAAAGVGGWLATARRRKDSPTAGRDGSEPLLEIPEGQRLVWLSRTTNSWFRLLAAVTGLVAVATLVAVVAGLAGTGVLLALFSPFAFVFLALTACSSVQARVSERGLEVSFGPLGRPVRRWAPADIESARAENRTPAQVGGWGYRLSGLGTTVMLRAGECLVVRIRGRRGEFAVSVDDAERGAALLNALTAPR
ncbi:hypothetical protein J2Z21_003761 [Streptomyces griseochromogenes]|uniref:DUF1648 domain-containing protein n=1 Tax=Streptomyces griseochromogenes TaxID=68214 RepID=A0A1B1ANV8_9ACTN|nr:DUF1648 domain-containing protein [Streptomyces griseochromogenes]ANP48257.1 DUF1648 domain-containing protein [Streptomyces griseochromogenes]MBP2050811.1 hypothetical protein [Streptomyces griseochromogenes]